MNDTPETDAVLKQFEHHLPNWLASEIIAAVARKLERERDESIRYADSLAELLPVKMLPKDIENVRNANSEMAQEICRLERERDEAVNSCHIWQKGHSALVSDRDGWKKLAVEQEKEIEEWKVEVERWRSLAQGWRKEAVDAIKDTRE